MMNSQTEMEGEVSIFADPRVDSLVQLHIAYNEAFPVIPGYRIQIFMQSGNQALSNAEEIIEEFTEKNKDMPAYLRFTAPYYRVRIGDFRTRLEAEKFLHEIEIDYPQAFVVMDEINFPSLD